MSLLVSDVISSRLFLNIFEIKQTQVSITKTIRWCLVTFDKFAFTKTHVGTYLEIRCCMHIYLQIVMVDYKIKLRLIGSDDRAPKNQQPNRVSI